MSLINLERTQMSANVTRCWCGCVFVIHANNASNSINRKVMLQNLNFIDPIIVTYIVNYYANRSNLFIVGWEGILSSEGTTLGDSKAMRVYALGILQIIKFLLKFF